MRDLAVHGDDLIVATHGRSFWVLDDIAPLRQFTQALGGAEAALLEPSVAVRVRRSTDSDTPIQPDEPAARNPPTGAIIDYFLRQKAAGAVTIEVLDAAGEIVRRVARSDPPAFTREELERELIPSYWIRLTPALGTGAGMHRWVWDLHYETPRSPRYGFPISAVPGDTPREPAGPLASPGDYRVRLRVGTHVWEAPLRVVADPRVAISPADFAAQFALARRLAAGLDASTGALLEARSIAAQLKGRRAELERDGAAPLLERLKPLETRVSALLDGAADASPPGAPGLEAINGRIGTLYEQVAGVDAAPTQAQVDASDQSLEAWRGMENEWRRAARQDIPPVDAVLRKAHLPGLGIDRSPPRDLEFADEE